MTKSEYELIGSLLDCLEFCYQELEYLDPKDDEAIRKVMALGNKQIEQGYLD